MAKKKKKTKMKLIDFLIQICTDTKMMAAFQADPEKTMKKISKKHRDVIKSKNPAKIRLALVEEDPLGMSAFYIFFAYTTQNHVP